MTHIKPGMMVRVKSRFTNPVLYKVKPGKYNGYMKSSKTSGITGKVTAR